MTGSQRVLVGLKNAEQMDELMELAVSLGGPTASLLIVHVIELPDVTPLDAAVPDLESAAGEMLGKAEGIARLRGMTARTEILRAHGAAAALLDEMRVHKIDLAILGYHHDRSFGEIMLGTTARHVARHAPCRVLLNIPPREGR